MKTIFLLFTETPKHEDEAKAEVLTTLIGINEDKDTLIQQLQVSLSAKQEKKYLLSKEQIKELREKNTCAILDGMAVINEYDLDTVELNGLIKKPLRPKKPVKDLKLPKDLVKYNFIGLRP